MNDTVSVVATCHNLERYIGEAIDSAIGQSYPGRVEVIVVDDGSTDASATIIQSRANVRYLRTPKNLGVLMATVFGLRAASGDLVFFLDGDDVWHPDKLRLAVERFEADADLGLLTHDLEYIDGDGHVLARSSRPGEAMRHARASENDDAMTRDGILLHSDYVWLGSAYAIRRSKIDAEGFCAWAERLPDPFNTYQDWPLAYWAACRPGAKMGYVPAKLFQYRVHAANYSGNASDADKALRNVRRTRNTMQAIEQIAIASRLPDPAMRATRRKLRYYECLLALYEGRRIAACRGFFLSLPYLFGSTENPVKELARFAGVQLLGLRGFISMVNRLHRNGSAQA
jgi:glycosyltransferase involved in cell wall biosynthesis